MNVVENIEQYNEKNIYFCEPIKNNVMNNGNFIRIIYSNDIFILNGVNLFVKLYDVVYEKYYNKYKCSFNLITQSRLIDTVKQIEEELLEKVNIRNKIPQFKIYEQLKNGNIKLFMENSENLTNGDFMLKISGVWETDTNYGLTYKFIKANYP
jgi:hypothetical protein